MDDAGGCIGAILLIALAGLVIYLFVMAISAIAAVSAVAGCAWGGGTSVLNYARAFKENVKPKEM